MTAHQRRGSGRWALFDSRIIWSAYQEASQPCWLCVWTSWTAVTNHINNLVKCGCDSCVALSPPRFITRFLTWRVITPCDKPSAAEEVTQSSPSKLCPPLLQLKLEDRAIVIRDIVRRNNSNVSRSPGVRPFVLFLAFPFMSTLLFVSQVTVQRSVPFAESDATGIIMQFDTYKGQEGDYLCKQGARTPTLNINTEIKLRPVRGLSPNVCLGRGT